MAGPPRAPSDPKEAKRAGPRGAPAEVPGLPRGDDVRRRQPPATAGTGAGAGARAGRRRPAPQLRSGLPVPAAAQLRQQRRAVDRRPDRRDLPADARPARVRRRLGAAHPQGGRRRCGSATRSRGEGARSTPSSGRCCPGRFRMPRPRSRSPAGCRRASAPSAAAAEPTQPARSRRPAPTTRGTGSSGRRPRGSRPAASPARRRRAATPARSPPARTRRRPATGTPRPRVPRRARPALPSDASYRHVHATGFSSSSLGGCRCRRSSPTSRGSHRRRMPGSPAGGQRHTGPDDPAYPDTQLRPRRQPARRGCPLHACVLAGWPPSLAAAQRAGPAPRRRPPARRPRTSGPRSRRTSR